LILEEGRKRGRENLESITGVATRCGAQRCLERSHDPAEVDTNSAERPAAPTR